MSRHALLRNNMIQVFGNAYQAFGLNRVMGHVVAALMFSPEPLSLDEICLQLNKSKGPISQITRRLVDHNLIRRVWVPGSRKDYYEVHPEIFTNAFRYNFKLIKHNTIIAKQFKNEVNHTNDETLHALRTRLNEMERFYELMEENYQQFIDRWETTEKNASASSVRLPKKTSKKG